MFSIDNIDRAFLGEEEALNRQGSPEIVNTDHGSQFTVTEFVKAVADSGCRLNMDD